MLILLGCSTAIAPSIHEYTIYSPHEAHPSMVARSSKALRIAATKSVPSLLSKHIYYLRPSGESGHYLYSRWSDIPPVLIERNLHTLLEEKALFSALLTSGSHANAEWILESDLSAFYHRFDSRGNSQAVIDMTYRLIDSGTKRLIASKRFLITPPSPTEDAPGGVKALTQATNELTEQCTLWLAEQIKNNP